MTAYYNEKAVLDSAEIIQLRPAPECKAAPPPTPEQLYREACWRLLDVCLRGASREYIREAAREMWEARYADLEGIR